MKKHQYPIECVRCGESSLEFLTVEEMEKLSDAIGLIYRQCEGCGKTAGWINSSRPPVATKEPVPRPVQTQPVNSRAAESRPLKGQERMATQAERDNVNLMVYNNS